MKIAIIGAGAAGLAALRHCLDEGHESVSFEQSENVGGTWNYVEKTGTDEYGLPIHSSMYEGLRTNLPKELMQYEDFPYTKPDTSYISQKEVLEYLNSYANFFNLLPHIRFLVHVQQVDSLPGQKWKVRVKYLKTGEIKEDQYDAVLVCVGNYSVPRLPKVQGADEFKGTVIHSHSYRTPDAFKNRKVLVVGAGPSGSDISKLISEVADKVFISIREKPFLNLSQNVLIKPDISKLEGTKVIFKDGTKEDIDDVIFCTGNELQENFDRIASLIRNKNPYDLNFGLYTNHNGYTYSYPFLSPNCGITVENNWVKHLYKQIINIEYPTMGFIGIPFRVTPFPIFGVQVRFFLEFLKGNITISKEQMLQELKEYMQKKKDENSPPHHAHFLGLKQGWYMEDIAETANIKKVPPVIYKLYEYVSTMAKGKSYMKYKIINDNEFVHEP